jgi:regulation of enolase protein 1 (concanavalin A-like superfamily)
VTLHIRSVHTLIIRLVAVAAGLLVLATPARAQTTPPDDWISADIGGGSGAWGFNDSGFMVEGVGADIWGTADSFHFAYQQLNGDGELRAQLRRVTGPHDWSKVGLMIRSSLEPGAAHHFLLGSVGKGLAYQRRPSTGGSSLHTSLAPAFVPTWFRIVRTGPQVQLGMSSDGVNWTQVATVTWPTGPTFVGFAATSHDSSTQFAQGIFEDVALTGNGSLAPNVSVVQPSAGATIAAGQPFIVRWQATATSFAIDHFDLYSGVEQGGRTVWEAIPGCSNIHADTRQCTWMAPEASDSAHVLVVATDQHNNLGRADSGRFTISTTTTGLPEGWSSRDIGAVGIAGSTSFDGAAFSVRGSGADIWGTADAFHFAHVTMSGDFSITARVAQVENVNQWTKAGVMIREGLAAGDRHMSFFATPTPVKGTAIQFRRTTGGTSSHVGGPPGDGPIWVKLVRIGPAISAYYRRNITDPWTPAHREVFDTLAGTLDVGLAVSSHNNTRTALGRFTDVIVEALPPWQTAAIASTGSASTDQTIFALFGKGSDIWGTADALFYTYVPWVGDGTMIARVRSLEPSHAWAKAGVMFRESATPGSKHVFALVSAERGLALQYRSETGGQSASAGGATGAAPVWLRLTRRNNTFTAESSVDGRSWTTFGTVTVAMGGTVAVGIAHTSHNPSADGGAVFDDVRITP